MNNFLLQTIIAFITSISSFFLCHKLLKLINPKIAISGNIAKGKDKDKTIHRIKIINRGNKVLHVRAKFLLMEKRTDQDNIVEVIPLRINEISYLSKFGQENKRYTYFHNFSTHENIEEKLVNDAYFLKIEVNATHPFSGAEILISQNYNKKSIKNGNFRYGNTFEIVPES